MADYGNTQQEKKGMLEQVKEKIPGGGAHKTGEQMHSTTGPGGCGGVEQPHNEKKGMAEQVKEKIPGGGGHATTGEQKHPTTTTGTGAGGYGGVGQPQPEKKGMVEKIKEKLPGGNK